MKRYQFLLILLCSVGILFIAHEAWPRQSPEAIAAASHRAKLVEDFGGSSGFDTVRYAERAQAFRISLPQGAQDSSITSYTVDAGPIEVPVAAQQTLAVLLTKPESYYWPTVDSVHGCGPEYGVRLTFFRGGQQVEVNLCYNCISMLLWHNGNVTGNLDFSPSKKELAQFAKQFFPDDLAIQKLP
jgi:hypothetical protein